MKKKNRLLRFAFVLAFLVSLGLGNELRAADWYSSGPVTLGTHSTNWWSTRGGTGSQPTSWETGDTYIVQNGHALALVDAQTAAVLRFESGATVTASATIGFTGAIEIQGNITFPAFAITATSITIDASRTLTLVRALTTSGALNVNGTLAAGAYNLTIGGLTTVANGGVITSTAGTRSFAAITNNGNFNVGGAITATGNIAGTGTWDNTAVITVSGTAAQSIVGGLSIVGLTVNKSTNPATLSGALTLSGTLTITDGTLAVGTGNLSVASTSIANAATAVITIPAASGTRDFGALTLGGANAVLDLSPATGGSNRVSIASAPAASKLVTDEYSDLVIGATMTLPAEARAVRNLTVSNTYTLTLGGATTVSGTLTATGGVTVGANTLTVNGTLDGAGAIIADQATSALVLNGPITYTGTITGATTTTLEVGGTGAVTLPTINTGLEKLTINKTDGATVKLGANLNLAGTAGALTFATGKGKLDLNGKDLAIASSGTIVGETATETIINSNVATAADADAFVQVTAANYAALTASNIGIVSAAPTDIATITAKRFPVSLPIPTGSNSVSRYYSVAFTTGGPITSLGLKYWEASEINGNTKADLMVFEATDAAFTTDRKVAITNTVSVADQITATGGLLGTTGKFYAIASGAPLTGAAVPTSGNWNNPDIWGGGLPPADADIAIPAGVTLTVPAGYTATAKNISIAATGTLVLDRVAAGNSNLNITGDLDISTTAANAISIGGVAGNAQITIDGNLNLNSATTLDLRATTAGFVTLEISGAINNNAGATILTNGAATTGTILNLTGTTSVTLPSTINQLNHIIVNKNGAKVYLSGDLAVLGNTTVIAAGELVVGDNNYSDTHTEVQTGALFNGNYTNPNITRIFGLLDLQAGATLTSVGPKHPTGYNNTFNGGTGALSTHSLANGSVLNISQSKTTITDEFVAMGAGASATIIANGTTLNYAAAAWNMVRLTLQTDAHTDLTMAATGLVENFPAISELNDLTIGSNQAQLLKLYAHLTLTGDLTINDLGAPATSLNTNNFNLTVNGTYTNNQGATTESILDLGTGTLTLNGPIALWGTDETALDVAAGSFVIGGAGSIAPFPAATAAGVSLGTFTMNRPNTTLNLSAVGQAVTFGALTITNGAVTVPSGTAMTVTNATVINANGTLTADASAAVNRTFSGSLGGSGKLSLNGASAVNLATAVIDGTFTFDGNMVTNEFTVLDINSTMNGSLNLPSSITKLNDFQITRGAIDKLVTLNNDLILTVVATPNTNWVSGTLVLNGKNLTLSAGIAAGAAAATFAVDATASSTMTFGNTTTNSVNFTNWSAITEDETTNLVFRSANAGAHLVTTTAFNSAFSQCNNLTIELGAAVTSNTVLQTGNLTINGNLIINSEVVGGAAAVILDKATHTLTVNGDISNNGTMTLNDAGGLITLKGQFNNTGVGVITTDATSYFSIEGAGNQFVLPSDVATIGTLVLNRASGMKLTGDLTVGDGTAATDLTLTQGDLDLNGNNITLATATTNTTDVISEAAGATIINTGASTLDGTQIGAVITPTLTAAEIMASGIGVSTISGGNYVVRRFPTVLPISGVGLSVGRVYQISSAAPNVASELALQFDNTEVASNTSALRLYTSASPVFTIFDDRTKADGSNRAVNQNTPVSGKGNVTYSELNTTGQNAVLAANDYYTMAAVPGTGGVLYTAAANGEWTSPTTWTPNGTPTMNDQIYIGPQTVTLRGDGQVLNCQTLVLGHNSAKLIPYNNGTNGDKVTLNVMGNITLSGGASIDAINGSGRLNITVGDGVTAGVSSTISAPTSYVVDNGLSVNNFTINGASVAYNGDALVRIYGDLAMLGNAAYNSATSSGTIEFFGGSNSVQNISIPSSASMEIFNIKATNSANVLTNSSFTLNGTIQVDPTSSFEATNGTITFPLSANQTGWAVQEGAVLARLFNVEIAGTANNFAPIGTMEIAGNFTKTGASNFNATNANTVLFRNSGQKEIVVAGAGNMNFYNLTVSPNASVKTSSSFSVEGNIDVQQDASLVADNGTIDITTGAVSPSRISNVSDHTLNFFNLTCTDDVVTSNNWKISGDLQIDGSLVADNGTVTFENVSEKTITNDAANAASDLTFFGVKVADGSKVKTSAVVGEGEFTIKNNATNPTGAGIFVEGTGQLVVTAPADFVYFDAGLGLSAGNPKTISKSTNGVLKLGKMQINTVANNEVASASDFELQGIDAGTFTNAGAGGKFTATAGSVVFTGSAPTISSVSPALTSFYGVKTTGTTVLTLTAAHEIFVTGNITVDGSSKFAPADQTAKVMITGDGEQIFGGTSTLTNPIQFGRLVINKANDSQVLMNKDVEIFSNAASQLVLTNGILNLGSKTLTVGAGVISRLNGAINGATGTYLVNTNHKGTMLEDAYFTVNNVPTLNNLTVSAAHITANDLTVNGTLNLNSGTFTIAAGTSLPAAKQLILNGNLTRTAGTITTVGTAEKSKLVFQGTGTVNGGLQQPYFGTVPSIVMARQETLGGNLTMDANANLTINTGTKYFDLSNRTLTLGNTGGVSRISGSITAGVNSTINFGQLTRVPANLFTGNQVGGIVSTTGSSLTLDGDLIVNTSLNFPADKHIFTGENSLTFSPSMLLINPMTSANHVKGNLIRTVNSNGVVEFPIGSLKPDGTASEYTPVSMRLATSGKTQQIKVSTVEIDPTIGRGGNAKNAINLTYNISTIGTLASDSVLVKFQYSNPSRFEQVTPVANGAFPAKWNGLGWTDYRNRLANFTVANPRVITMTGYPVALNNLSGTWGIFTVSTNSNDAKDKAISMTANRVVITKLEPNPVNAGQAFKVTVQLQDPNGQPITVTQPFTVRLETEYGQLLSTTTIDAIIPAGSSMTTATGLTINTAYKNNQLRADTVGGSANWQPTLSDPFAVIDAAPATQASNIAFSNVKETSMTVTWNNGSGAAQNTIIIAKAESSLEDSEFPVNANTYIANTNFGSGSSIGNATVIYNASATSGSNSIQVTGLSPNTNYYFYALAYSGKEGYENYKRSAVTYNPNAQKTTGTSDDDVSLGSNNTLADSRPIGTNTPVTGTIGSAIDEDWFNFSVTNATPNVRVQLYGLANNYNVEVYDMAGRRIRRGIRTATGSEGPVVNSLPAGTYTLRIYSADGSYSSTNAYTLKVGTKSSEIFSVTP